MAKAMYEDKLLKKLTEWAGLETDRASEVGLQRADMKEFLEATGWEKTALSWARRLDKMSVEKRADLLRSLDDLREILRTHWDDQSSGEMDLSGKVVPFTNGPADDDAPAKGNAPSYVADLDIDDAPVSFDDAAGDPDIQEEADDFEAALAEAAE